MSDELKAAANRFADYDLADFQGPTGDCADIRAGIALSRYVLADLAAREAKERERALPIDREWLRQQGQDIGMDVLVGGLSLIVANSTWSKIFAWKSHDDPSQEWFIKTCTTRGEVMDLIAMFPTDEKGGAE